MPNATADYASLPARLGALLATRFSDPRSTDGWTFSAMEGIRDQAQRHGVILVFRCGARTLALLLQRRDDSEPAYARTQRLNVSHLRRWNDVPCDFDRALVDACLTVLREAEAADVLIPADVEMPVANAAGHGTGAARVMAEDAYGVPPIEPRLPLVDLEALLEPGAARETALAEMQRCARAGACGLIPGRVVPDAVMDEALAAIGEFFALALVVKQRYAAATSYNAVDGYTNLASQRRERLLFNTAATAYDPMTPNPLRQRTAWPDELGPQWLQALEAFLAALDSAGQLLLGAIEETAPAAVRGLTPRFEQPAGSRTVLFSHYTEFIANDAAELGEHTDLFPLMLVVESSGGLEVKVGDTWCSVPSSQRLVCMFGDTMPALTGGRYPACRHRVRWHGDSDRLSVVYAMNPSMETPIACADELAVHGVEPGAVKPYGEILDRWFRQHG